MTFDEFRESLQEDESGAALTDLLRALWYEGRGDWTRAHQIAQETDTTDGARVHAYLHRKEGDLGNARYWYSTAGREECRDSPEHEWEQLVREFLLSSKD